MERGRELARRLESSDTCDLESVIRSFSPTVAEIKISANILGKKFSSGSNKDSMVGQLVCFIENQRGYDSLRRGDY